jgi:hypothetical protein
LVTFDAAIEKGITSILCLELTSMVSISKSKAARSAGEVIPITSRTFAAIKLRRTNIID